MERKMKEKEEEKKDTFYSPERTEEGDKDGEICSSDDKEKAKLVHLRAIVEKQDPACKDIDDLTLTRFLHARDLDVEKASQMFIKYLTWRRTFVPNGSIPLSEIRNQVADNKICMQGKDKKGCPVGIIFGARHFPSKQGIDELKRLMVFYLDKLCSRIPDGQGTFTIISDLQGYGYSNMDVRGHIAAISIIQDYYPGRLEKVLIIHAPYLFMTTWKAIYPFIDKKIKKKFVFVEKNRVKATLLEEVEENQLPEIYGGKLKLVPIHQDG